MGKEVNGIYRTTVVTNEDGVITHIIDNVVSGDHSNQLIKALGL
jgi:peroxiredoxin